jgi:soluble lytic murein transglycosylase-like protein
MMLKSRLLPAITAFAVAIGSVSFGSAAKADGTATEVAAISGAAGRLGRQTALPAILADADLITYRQAFEHQRLGQWPAADRDISRLDNPLLIGTLLAKRYLSGGYHASGEELAGWMARFADLPQANEIFTLAKQRLGSRANGLKPPSRANGAVPHPSFGDEQAQWDDSLTEPPRILSAAERRQWQVSRDRIKWFCRHDRQDQAAAMIRDSATQKLFSSHDLAELKASLAMAYFADGQIDAARQWANDAATADALPQAQWVAGLAAWRSGDRVDSARHFEAVANAPGLSSWSVAAGAFWAARANLAAHRPQVVNHWLQQAAAYPRTFYGLLARRALGQDIEYSWASHPFTEIDAEIIRPIPAAQRALALIQLGDRAGAEDELRQILPTAGPALARSLLAVANDGDLPSLAVQASTVVAERDGRHHDAGDYPLPNWKPISGWSIDRALLLAIAKQESGFNPHARNPSGAIGLMQLMPATARTVGANGHLTDPQVNLDLGQRYVHRLLEADGVKGNLLCLAAAYNAGPATVARWLQTIKPGDDALLFLESIPFRETRSLVEHVLTNFWAYRNRFDQSSPSLDAIAAGSWPMYDAPELKARNQSYVQN